MAVFEVSKRPQKVLTDTRIFQTSEPLQIEPTSIANFRESEQAVVEFSTLREKYTRQVHELDDAKMCSERHKILSCNDWHGVKVWKTLRGDLWIWFLNQVSVEHSELTRKLPANFPNLTRRLTPKISQFIRCEAVKLWLWSDVSNVTLRRRNEKLRIA